jgi:hypothetical protein
MSGLESAVGQPAEYELKVFSEIDPDPEKAGQGLAFAPLVFESLQTDQLAYWMMAPAEQMAMVYLLERLMPKVAIEIGTRFGGSLQVLSRFSERVYSLDIDPEVPRRMQGRFPNVEFLIGPSDQTLPPLLDRLQSEGAEVSFVLVDGDHSAEGVRKDIESLVRLRPTVDLYVVMHDSFNPECRRGLRDAEWASCPYVHAVELDFVPGCVNPSPAFRGQLWGGLALGILKPQPRRGGLEVVARSELTYRAAHDAELRQQGKPRIRRPLSHLRRMARGPAELAASRRQGTMAKPISVEVAPGELIDKITILEIKAERITDPGKRANVLRELRLLTTARDRVVPPSTEIEELTTELRRVNMALWDVEDALRVCERQERFDSEFIDLARSVYKHNDQRAVFKRRVNELLGSSIREEKSYS